MHEGLAGIAGARAWLIGSLARGAFGERSDVDVVVAGLDHEQTLDLFILLGDHLGSEVDLLRLEELGADFRDRVRREGEVLHVA